jgi:pimeloyl-ACP methyl ester carboxylesterase
MTLINPFCRHRVLALLSAPNPVPDTLRRLPLGRAAQPMSLLSMTAELRSFNKGMHCSDPRVGPAIPVIALLGRRDRTAVPDWHEPWPRSRVAALEVRAQSGVGHMLHHVRPDLAWQAVQDAFAARSVPAQARSHRCERVPAE